MRIKDVASTIVTMYNSPENRSRTLYLVGPSGIGKSDTVKQAAVALSTETEPCVMYDLRLSTADPTDFGLLMPVDGELVRQKPAFIAYMEKHPRGLFFLDEITSAPPAVQAPAYQITNDRMVNGFPIPDGWMVVAAGNRASDRGVTYAMAAPLLNRMTEIEVDTVLDDVLEYGASNGMAPEVMAFLKSRGDLLHRFGKGDYGKQFPSPRSWMSVSNKLSLPVTPALRAELIRGDVGHEAGLAFEQFLRVWRTMPDIDQILVDPDSVEVPESLDVRYCLTMGLAARVDKKNFANAWSFMKRMPREMGTLVGRLASRRDPSINRSPAFHEWLEANEDIFTRI